jgi:large subunit ribosomal protein L3
MMGLLGKKIRMTQLFDEKGRVIPCTIVKLGPCYVVQKKIKEKDGYWALQLGFEEKKKGNKPMMGHFKKANLPVMRYLKEFKVENVDQFEVGQELKIKDVFKEGDLVDVTGWTKGRGFAGGMKRWGWSGGPASHGSQSHRRIGSLGSGTDPGRPWKGRTLPGHYGCERITVKNLKIIKIDEKNCLVYISGAIPGYRNSLVIVKKAKSTAGKET